MIEPRRARAPRVVSLVLVLLASVAGCGPAPSDGGPAATDTPTGWPLRLAVDAVLGYGAVRLDGSTRAAMIELLDFAPEGLDTSKAALALALDATVLGGPLGLALPLRDESAFRASVLACPLVTPVRGDRLRVALPPDHPIQRALLLSRAMISRGGVAEMLASLGGTQTITFELELLSEGGFALLVPSFEAGQVGRQALAELPVSLPLGDGEFIVSADAERVRLAFYEEFENLGHQIRGLAGGTSMLGGMTAMMASSGGGGGPPVNGAALGALLTMFDLEAVGALQLHRGPDVVAGEPSGLGLQLRHDRPTPLTDVLSSLRPTPAIESGISLSADPEAFAVAMRSFCAPLGPLVKGDGPPAERYLDDLVRLLEPWSGRVALQGAEEGSPGVLFIGQREGWRFDRDGWARWMGELFDAAGADLDGGLASLLDGGGAVLAPRDDGLLLFDPEADAVLIEGLADGLASAEAPDVGAVLRADFPRGPRPVQLALDVEDLDLLLSVDLSPGPGGR